jgi:hypothetical protein
MAYRAKDTRTSMRRAQSKKGIVDDALDSAMDSLVSFNEKTEKIAKTEKTMKDIQDINYLIQYSNKQTKRDRADYDVLESTFSDILKKKQSTDPSIDYKFPTFNEYRKGDFKPSIADQYYNETVLNYMKAGMGEDILSVIMKGMK